MNIAVASGKGGTGKSTVALNLAYYLAKRKKVNLLDCDVEEPNCSIFLKAENAVEKDIFSIVPSVDKDKCVLCKKCSEVCQFNAIACTNKEVLVFEELCHSCLGCILACPVGALSKANKHIGKITKFKKGNINFIEGKLKIGEPMSPPLIKEVKKEVENDELTILDSPPGTSCPMVTTVNGCDFVILTAEPTPFGLNDLVLAVETVKKIGIKFGIVINKSSENDYLIDDYANKEGIKILAKIPDDRKIAEIYSRGEIILEKMPELEVHFAKIKEAIL